MRLPEPIKSTVETLMPTLILSGCVSAHHPEGAASLAAPSERAEARFLEEVREAQAAVKGVTDAFMVKVGLGYVQGDFEAAQKKWDGQPWYYPEDFHLRSLDCQGQIGKSTNLGTHLDPSLYASCVTYVPDYLNSDPIYLSRTERPTDSPHVPQVFVRLSTELPNEKPVRTLAEERGDRSTTDIDLIWLEGETPESPLCVGGKTAYRYWNVDQMVSRPGPTPYFGGTYDHYEASMEEVTHLCPTEEGRPRHYTTYVFQSFEGENYHEKSVNRGDFDRTEDVLIHPLASEAFEGGVGYDRLYRLRSSSAPLNGNSEGYGENRHSVYEPRKTTELDANGSEIQGAMAATFNAVWDELVDAEEAVRRVNARE